MREEDSQREKEAPKESLTSRLDRLERLVGIERGFESIGENKLELIHNDVQKNNNLSLRDTLVCDWTTRRNRVDFYNVAREVVDREFRQIVRTLTMDAFYPFYYLDRYPDVAAALGSKHDSAGAVRHFRSSGMRQGRSPSPFFEPIYYLEQHDDVRLAVNGSYEGALRHWLRFGIRSGRAGSTHFSLAWYLDSHQDLYDAVNAANDRRSALKAAFSHWLRFGVHEGRRTSTQGSLKIVSHIGDFRNFNSNYSERVRINSVKWEKINVYVSMAKIILKLSGDTRIEDPSDRESSKAREAAERTEEDRAGKIYDSPDERDRCEVDRCDETREICITEGP